MPEIITRRAMPETWEELPPDFRPLFVQESDVTRTFEEDGRIVQRQRRTRVLVYVTPDGEQAVLPFDLGPANKRQPWVMPCGGGTEIAHIWELMEWMDAKATAAEQREAARVEQRTAEWLLKLEAEQEERDRKLVGMTSVGPYVRVQREGPNVT